MLRHAVVAECRKLKGSCIWLAFLFLPAFSVFVGSANFSMNRDILTKEWQSLWTQVSLFYGDLFLAVLLSIYAAYAWRLEHLNHNWNNLMTAPVPVRNIFWSKFLVIAGLSFVTQVFFFALYLAAGFYFGFQSSIPPDVVRWFLCAWFGSLPVAAMQLFFAMRIRSFAVPVGIGFCCSVVGFILAVKGWWPIFPNALLIAGMGSVSQEALGEVDMGIFFVMCAMFTVIFCGLSLLVLKRTDVKS